MTHIPNTPDELLSMAAGGQARADLNRVMARYRRPLVVKVMEDLAPDRGGTLGDLQAVADLCLATLIRSAHELAESHKHPNFAKAMASTEEHLKAAQSSLAMSPFIAMSDK